MIYSGIYKIENIINHKIYIGQSKDIETRWEHHKWELNNHKHSNNYLHNIHVILGITSNLEII